MYKDELVKEKLKYYQVGDLFEEAVEELNKMYSEREQELNESLTTARLELAKRIVMDVKQLESVSQEELEEKENEIDRLEQELDKIARFRGRLE